MTHGLYRVTGNRAYRGHPPGSEFTARLEPMAERRALDRDAITLIERFTPTLPERFSLPRGWIDEGGTDGR